MSKNKIGDISHISHSTLIFGDNNQSTSNEINIEDSYSRAKQLITYYKDEQERKKKVLKERLLLFACFFIFICLISTVCYFVFPEETTFAILGFGVSLIGTIVSVYAYFNSLQKPNQTQQDYSNEYNNIIRILNYHRRQDLVSELAKQL